MFLDTFRMPYSISILLEHERVLFQCSVEVEVEDLEGTHDSNSLLRKNIECRLRDFLLNNLKRMHSLTAENKPLHLEMIGCPEPGEHPKG
jgi:hypothetical protein